MGTVVNVSTASELMDALNSATGNVTILLAPGDYGRLEFSDKHYDGEVIIQSQDPSNPASFSSAKVVDVDNLTFDSVKFDYVAPEGMDYWYKVVRFGGCDNLTIRNSVFDGDLAHGVNEISDGYPTGYALWLQAGTNVTIENNEFFNFHRAGVFGGGTDGLNVIGNDIHDIRSDGFDFTQVTNTLIEGNYFHDFRGNPDSNDHMDMIQFWTTGSTEPSENITIRANFFDSGTGWATQTIFMGNEEASKLGEAIYYRNVVIEDNVIYNASLHGITVGSTIGLEISNNTILHNADTADYTNSNIPTIILKGESQEVIVVDNILSRPFGGQDGWIVDNNLVLQRKYPFADNYYGDFFVNALADSLATLDDLRAIPGGLIEQLGVGSSLTRFSVDQGELDGYVLTETGQSLGQMTHAFDAAHLFDALGPVDLAGATVEWDFDDGTIGEGMAISHHFSEPGTYNVKAVMTLAGGQVVELLKTVDVSHPVLLMADFNNGAEDLSSSPVPVEMKTDAGFEQGAIRLGDTGSVIYDAARDFYENSEFTLAFDFKKDVGQESSDGFALYFPYAFRMKIRGDGVAIVIQTDADNKAIVADGIGVRDAEWHRVVATFSSADDLAVLYLDGVEVGRVSGFGGGIVSGNASHDFHLGNPFGDNFTTGLLDNFAFLSGAMTQEQVEAYQAGASLEAIVTEASETAFADVVPSGTGVEQPVDQGGSDPVDTVDTSADTVGGSATLTGTEGADNLVGTDGDDTIVGLGGNDTLTGKLGSDTFVFGNGAGKDVILDFEKGVDKIAFSGIDSVAGFSDLTVIRQTYMKSLVRYTDDQGEIQEISVESDSRFKLNKNDFEFGTDGGGTDSGGIDGSDTIDTGTLDADQILGTEGRDSLAGTGADEQIFGLAGNDLIKAGGGNDWIDGGLGRDDLVGGEGFDTFCFAADGNRDRVYDFNAAEDVVELHGFSFHSAAEVIDSAVQLYRGTLFILDDSGTEVLLKGVDINDLSDANFTLIA